MTDMQRSATSAEPVRTTAVPSNWVGWIAFAAMLMIFAGTIHAIAGLTAIFNEDYYEVPSTALLVNVSYDTWGWVHLGFGVLAVAAGAGIAFARNWARILGIVLAGVSAIAAFGFVTANPVWMVVVIAVDVLTIYALAAHGRQMEALD